MCQGSKLGITSRSKDFDSVFVEVTTSAHLNLKNNNCLRLFHLDITNNQFNYAGLHHLLCRNIGRYVFSRATIEKFILDDDEEAIGIHALNLLRKASNPKDKGAGGELGEILLYMFLEQKLGAPKLLSKVELKTSGNQYVFGSDGVHLLTIDKGKTPIYQLILGESKIKGDLADAVNDAFDSIDPVAKNPETEIRLIDKNILAESFDEDTTAFIKSLVIPTKRDSKIAVDNAFGIFLGYTLGIDHSAYSNSEYRIAATKQMEADILAVVSHIEKKISNCGLSGYSFYFFIIPFDDAPKDRRDIINKLKLEGGA